MVRAAAKNFKNVTIITNNNDYKYLIKELEVFKGKTSLKFRELMSSKAFGLTAYYDAMIANWFNKKLKIEFPERKTIFGRKLQKLRYGENPHQKSSIYVSDYNDKNLGFNQIHGQELSYNNYNDMFASLEILNTLKKKSGTVIIKHTNPCGVSENKVPLISFKNAFISDPISAFGGVIACNYKINKKIAFEISKNFLEVLLANGFDKESLEVLKRKKNLRIIDISNFKLKNITSIKSFDRSFLLQSKDNIILDKKKLKCVTKLKPNKKELAEIQFAFNVCKHVKSNAIVLCNNFSTIGIGAGQPSRLDSCKIAVQKAKQFQSSKIKNSIAASDAFFPFADGINALIKAGVKTIVQPGGSIRDQEVINAANKARIKMLFTGIRHFNH
jgi:phosphoribosylaminoimidazolecarboxamide formyltransferase/IMP cyclohydrolase